MSRRWFYVPPDIDGWHEEGFEVREESPSADDLPVVCRDCRNEESARLIAVAPELLEAAKGALARYPELNKLRAAVERTEAKA